MNSTSHIVCGDGRGDFPDLGKDCCYGTVMNGPSGCTCWREVFDVDQAPAVGDEPPQVRPDGLCPDCAYRPGSPEKRSQPEYRGDAIHLEMIAEDGTPFYCHDNMRRVVEYRHPSGATHPAPPGAYQPGIRADGVPLRSDGRPALLCAGWHARCRALAAKLARETPTDQQEEVTTR